MAREATGGESATSHLTQAASAQLRGVPRREVARLRVSGQRSAAIFGCFGRNARNTLPGVWPPISAYPEFTNR